MRARILSSWLAFLLSCMVSASAVASERQDARLLNSTQVLTELMQMPEDNIPLWLLQRAHAIAIIPDVIKVGLGIGGRRGKGVLVIRNDNGAWSNPVFINLTGGSFGFQIGVQSTDVVLVFTSRQSIEGIVGGKVTLGADASVAAGPIGRQGSAATDIGLTAQVYSYSRASGLFAGVALDGSALTIDHRSNRDFYGQPGILASDIVSPDAPTASAPANTFIAAIDRVSGGRAAAPADTADPSRYPPPPSGDASLHAPPKQADESALSTYPMEDLHPGQEPPQ